MARIGCGHSCTGIISIVLFTAFRHVLLPRFPSTPWLPSLLQSGFINSYPFDPVGLNSPKHAINEVKNGRLAMVSTWVTGCYAISLPCVARSLDAMNLQSLLFVLSGLHHMAGLPRTISWTGAK